MDVSENSRTPKSSILIGFSIVKPSILGYPYFRKPPYLHSTSFLLRWSHQVHAASLGLGILTRCTPKRRNIWGPCLRRLTTLLWREHPLGINQKYHQPPVYERKTSYKPTNQNNVEGNKSMMIWSKYKLYGIPKPEWYKGILVRFPCNHHHVRGNFQPFRWVGRNNLPRDVKGGGFSLLVHWLVVSTHLNNISQIGNLLQIGVKTKNL